MDAIRVLLVDDHARMRAGVRALLEADGMAVVGEAETGEEGVRMARVLVPDVVLMDLSMPGCGGLEATRSIAALGRGIRILVLTVHAEHEYLLPVLEAGGSGYVTKTSADTELISAVRTVAAGDVFLYPRAVRVLLDGLHVPVRTAGAEAPLEVLSGREREVLTLTAEGYTAAEIGDRLRISSKTVDTYRQRVMDKLNLRHRSELVHFALRQGLLAAVG